MANFIGGSAYAMVRDISEGYILLSPTNLKKMQTAEFVQVMQEIDKIQRSIRGEAVDLENQEAIKAKNRKLQRLQQAIMVIQNYRAKMKR